MDKSQHLKLYLMSYVAFFFFILFTINAQLPTLGNWKPFAYGVIAITFFFLIHEGLRIFANLSKKIEILLFLFQIVITCMLLMFSIIQNMVIFIVFSIVMLISFIFSIYLKLKKAKDY